MVYGNDCLQGVRLPTGASRGRDNIPESVRRERPSNTGFPLYPPLTSEGDMLMETYRRETPIQRGRPHPGRTNGAPEADPGLDRFANQLVGESPVFRQALATVQRVAQFGATVLLAGETGTGKELVARAIHYLGAFRDGPLVPVNCGAIPEGLAENELFGHARGAYTGAHQHHAGVIAAAEGGTLFLDEIECLSLRCQAALLRVLQDQSYRPLGSDRTVQGRLRIIVASNRDLAAMVRDGGFRQDLYFRLSVLRIGLPALRERASDIPLLARHFIRKFAGQYQLPEKRLSRAAEAALMTHPWPGNVRELENFIHRAFLMSEGAELDVSQQSLSALDGSGPPQSSQSVRCDGDQIVLPQGKTFSAAKAEVIADFERRYLTRLMHDCGGNVSLAARLAGKERHTLRRLLQKHGLGREA
jgi:DNA-binding NtrC family response regulator